MEILSRLPAKSVCRFKCVSQHWRHGLIVHPAYRAKMPQTLTGFFRRIEIPSPSDGDGNIGDDDEGFLANLEIKSTLEDEIKAAQQSDAEILEIKEKIANGKAKCFSVDDNGVVYFGARLVVPKSGKIKELILSEAHESPLSIHPGSTKMYQDLRP